MPQPEAKPVHEPIEPAPVRQRPVSIGRRWLIALGLTALTAVLMGIFGYRWFTAQFKHVEVEVKTGQAKAARARLSWLTTLGLGGVEGKYWLGACEEAEGHVDQALAIWARIPRGSSRFANATVRRARLAIDQGRLAVAEEALESTSFPRGSVANELCEIMLQQVYLFTGRSDDLRRRKQQEWAVANNKADVLRRHWLIDEARAYAAGALRSRLDSDGRAAPDDDRVWLGRADLAIHTAQFAEADDWLKKCLAHRPDDPVVWRARLDWAMATDHLVGAVEAMSHLPTDWLEPERSPGAARVAGRSRG